MAAAVKHGLPYEAGIIEFKVTASKLGYARSVDLLIIDSWLGTAHDLFVNRSKQEENHGLPCAISLYFGLQYLTQHTLLGGHTGVDKLLHKQTPTPYVQAFKLPHQDVDGSVDCVFTTSISNLTVGSKKRGYWNVKITQVVFSDHHYSQNYKTTRLYVIYTSFYWEMSLKGTAPRVLSLIPL